jgi:hypothetical protein
VVAFWLGGLEFFGMSEALAGEALHEFVYSNRRALESDRVSAELHSRIYLVFRAAEGCADACNVANPELTPAPWTRDDGGPGAKALEAHGTCRPPLRCAASAVRRREVGKGGGGRRATPPPHGSCARATREWAESQLEWTERLEWR